MNQQGRVFVERTLVKFDYYEASWSDIGQGSHASFTVSRPAVNSGHLSGHNKLLLVQKTAPKCIPKTMANLPDIQTARGQGTIDAGITKLILEIDTTSIEAGEYDFAWRLSNFAWRHYPIVVRRPDSTSRTSMPLSGQVNRPIKWPLVTQVFILLPISTAKLPPGRTAGSDCATKD